MNRNSTTIIETIINQNKDEKITMNLTMMDLRRRFREEIERRFSDDQKRRLPFMKKIEDQETLDSDTIVEINNSTTSERRTEMMNEVINHSNSEENLSMLIENSSTITREYINGLLVEYANNTTIDMSNLYRVGNITLLYISNIEISDLNIDDILKNFRNSMYTYNNQQMIPQIREEIIVDYRIVLENQLLLNEEQLNTNSQQFWEGVKEREEVDKKERLANTALSRRRILITGGSILASMALSSYGITLPGVVGLMSRGLNTALDNGLSLPSTQDQNIIRVRDIWDLGLKKLFNIMK